MPCAQTSMSTETGWNDKSTKMKERLMDLMFYSMVSVRMTNFFVMALSANSAEKS